MFRPPCWGIAVMLPAETLPVVPAFTACTGATLVEVPEGTNTSASVMNCTPLFVETSVPLGIPTALVPLLVEGTTPVACTLPIADGREAWPGQARPLGT